MTLDELIEMSRTLGNPSERFAMLAEGNTSSHADEGSFWVKASGHSLCDIEPMGFARVAYQPLLDAFDRPVPDDAQVRAVLMEATLESKNGALPSVEAFMHAWLLKLPGVAVIGHTHPEPLLSILCTLDAREFAVKRIFPDEIVCCGPAACYVDYTDPGLPLAIKLRERVNVYMEKFGEPPKTIWLQNHGLIALGATAREVISATFMQAKAARILLGALQAGKDLRFLSQIEIERIHTRPDERYRQKLLWGKSECPLEP